MMRGYCGIGVYHPKTEENIGTLFRSAHLYGADFLFTIGRRYKPQASDTLKSWRHIPLFHYLTYDAFMEHFPHAARLVCIELDDTAQDLPEVHHPQQAVYLLGAEDHGLPPDILSGHQTIQIPMALANNSMNVAVAGSIVLYDRHIKALDETV